MINQTNNKGYCIIRAKRDFKLPSPDDPTNQFEEIDIKKDSIFALPKNLAKNLNASGDVEIINNKGVENG